MNIPTDAIFSKKFKSLKLFFNSHMQLRDIMRVCGFEGFGVFVKLRRGSGKDRQGMALKAKGLKA